LKIIERGARALEKGLADDGESFEKSAARLALLEPRGPRISGIQRRDPQGSPLAQGRALPESSHELKEEVRTLGDTSSTRLDNKTRNRRPYYRAEVRTRPVEKVAGSLGLRY
jgi:hypothetical protein